MNRESTFSLFVRRLPRSRSFPVAAGLEDVLGLLEQFRLSEAALRYLGSLGSGRGARADPGRDTRAMRRADGLAARGGAATARRRTLTP
jgi:nicotinic acid phosphoribosyltransferase